jgi:hypothetical protein
MVQYAAWIHDAKLWEIKEGRKLFLDRGEAREREREREGRKCRQTGEQIYD